jgi:hypothetical protein
MKQMLAVCPVCGADLTVTELACPACNTRIQSTFSTCRYCRLDEEQSRFLEVFLRCRGVIRDVERTLGISYPTVRGKLDALLDALGLVAEPEAEEDASQERIAVLEELDAGRITIQEAIQRLRQG